MRPTLDQPPERLATLTEGRRLLEQLRERYQALLDLHISPRAGAVRNGERTSAAQAGERGFDSRPPLQSQPGSARDGQRERRQRGRRAPAKSAAPSASSSAPVGTPTPASHTCSCERTFTSAHALRIHRARSHGEPSERRDNTASRAARRQARAEQAARAAAAGGDCTRCVYNLAWHVDGQCPTEGQARALAGDR